MGTRSPAAEPTDEVWDLDCVMPVVEKFTFYFFDKFDPIHVR